MVQLGVEWSECVSCGAVEVNGWGLLRSVRSGEAEGA